MSEYNGLKPDLSWLNNRLDDLRFRKIIWEGITLNRVHAELTLYNVSSQTALQKAISESVSSQEELTVRQVEQAESLQETLERSIKAQDRLANTQNVLTIVAVGIALLQLVGMFILPNL